MWFDFNDVRARYLFGGVWCAAVGSALFAALWWLSGTAANIWIVTLVAHGLATTHTFFVQRIYVFCSTDGKVWRQLWRFQLSYLCIGLFTAFFIDALKSQGIHPIAAQILAISLAAVAGYFAGVHFSFADTPIQFWTRLKSLIWKAWQIRTVFVVFAVCVAVLNHVWGASFYIDRAAVGHDFAFSALALLEGSNWIASNGLVAGLFNPPWFTPAWCGGAAFFADPQSVFYSPIQFLSFLLSPMLAAYCSLLLFSALAFWGSYALARVVLDWRIEGATIFAVLGISNSFVALRSAVGETAYQPLYVWTLLVLAICWPGSRDRNGTLALPSMSVGLCLTAWIQFGFPGMLFPAFLGATAFCLIVLIAGKSSPGVMLARVFLGALIAMALNASRLYENISLLRNFPRDFYSMPGFESLRDAFMAVVYSLVQPSDWTARFGLIKLVNSQFTAFPHEWAMNFGLGSLAFFLICGLLSRPWKMGTEGIRLSFRDLVERISYLLLLITLLLLPVLMLWADGSMRALIKQIPILNSTTWPMRWIVVLLPACQFLLAWPLQRLLANGRFPYAGWAMAVGTALILAGPSTEPLDYYLNPQFQSYDPRPSIRAHDQLHATGVTPISRLVRASPDNLEINRNDAMLSGSSEALCYNPIYGYRLEALPGKQRLREGSALEKLADNRSLMLNPSCLVHPTQNGCAIGDGFDLSSEHGRQQANLFLQRHPFEWERPLEGKLAALISQLAFWLLLVLTISWLWKNLLGAAPSKQSAPNATHETVT